MSTRLDRILRPQLHAEPRRPQWYGNFTDPSGVTHYTFAHLVQRTASLQAGVNFTATPDAHAPGLRRAVRQQGPVLDVRELSDPRAAAYDDRFQPYADPACRQSRGFNFKQFRSNMVLRWEYRPGSALFLVWQQGGRIRQAYGDPLVPRRFRRLFHQHPDNTFLIKVSHWFDW